MKSPALPMALTVGATFLLTLGYLWHRQSRETEEASPPPMAAPVRSANEPVPVAAFASPESPRSAEVAAARPLPTAQVAVVPEIPESEDRPLNAPSPQDSEANVPNTPVPFGLNAHRKDGVYRTTVINMGTKPLSVMVLINDGAGAYTVELGPDERQKLDELGYVAQSGDRITFHSPPYEDHTVTVP